MTENNVLASSHIAMNSRNTNISSRCVCELQSHIKIPRVAHEDLLQKQSKRMSQFDANIIV